MRRKKSLQEMNLDELIEWADHLDEQRKQRNARRRARRHWLKTAPREQTALRYRAEEKPCTVAQYLQAERVVLHFLDEFPDLKGNALAVLLTLSHTILHYLHPGEPCRGTRLLDCPAFSLHELCLAAVEIVLNYHLDPAFRLTRSQIFDAMVAFTSGIDQERLRFHTLLGDLPLDL